MTSATSGHDMGYNQRIGYFKGWDLHPDYVSSRLSYCLFCEKQFPTQQDCMYHHKLTHVFYQEVQQFLSLAINKHGGEPCFRGTHPKNYKKFRSSFYKIRFKKYMFWHGWNTIACAAAAEKSLEERK